MFSLHSTADPEECRAHCQLETRLVGFPNGLPYISIPVCNQLFSLLSIFSFSLITFFLYNAILCSSNYFLVFLYFFFLRLNYFSLFFSQIFFLFSIILAITLICISLDAISSRLIDGGSPVISRPQLAPNLELQAGRFLVTGSSVVKQWGSQARSLISFVTLD